MSEGSDIMEWIFKGLVGIVLSIGAWLWINMTKAVAKTREDLTTANILTGLLGQAAVNGSIVKLQVWGY